MNIKSIAAFVVAIASFTVLSCKWFANAETEKPASSLTGRWYLDSLTAGKDSSIVYAFIGMAMEDSSGVEVDFREDTVFTFSGNHIDTSLYQYDADKQQLLIKDSTAETMTVSRPTDSTLSLTTKDQAVIFLKKR